MVYIKNSTHSLTCIYSGRYYVIMYLKIGIMYLKIGNAWHILVYVFHSELQQNVLKCLQRKLNCLCMNITENLYYPTTFKRSLQYRI